jgi:hypothetical protein
MDRSTPRAAAPKPPSSKPRRWQPDPRNTRALDRFIASTYGPEWVRWSRE